VELLDDYAYQNVRGGPGRAAGDRDRLDRRDLRLGRLAHGGARGRDHPDQLLYVDVDHGVRGRHALGRLGEQRVAAQLAATGRRIWVTGLPNAVLGTPVQLSGSQQSTSEWFNTAAFAAPPNFTFGNLGRNTVIGPGLVNLDLVLVKTFYIREGLRLELRAEAFNIANHPNYSVIGRILNDPTFGRVLSQLDPRQLQFGAKVVF